MTIKYFHELTGKEVDDMLKTYPKNATYKDIEKDYPQPSWCSYPGAINGSMGCLSLFYQYVTGEDYCKKCECYIKLKKNRKGVVEQIQ
jgi:hypothetical protein